MSAWSQILLHFNANQETDRHKPAKQIFRTIPSFYGNQVRINVKKKKVSVSFFFWAQIWHLLLWFLQRSLLNNIIVFTVTTHLEQTIMMNLQNKVQAGFFFPFLFFFITRVPIQENTMFHSCLLSLWLERQSNKRKMWKAANTNTLVITISIQDAECNVCHVF